MRAEELDVGEKCISCIWPTFAQWQLDLLKSDKWPEISARLCKSKLLIVTIIAKGCFCLLSYSNGNHCNYKFKLASKNHQQGKYAKMRFLLWSSLLSCTTTFLETSDWCAIRSHRARRWFSWRCGTSGNLFGLFVRVHTPDVQFSRCGKPLCCSPGILPAAFLAGC